jgi:cysteinyl-tRNA synthetase
MLKLYNTLTKKKEEFKPIHAGKVGIYVCGPTVYDFCHLGHARGYVSADILRRYLEYSGYEVRHIMNYTDVGHQVNNAETGEDKIQKKAVIEKATPIEIADKYIKFCEKDFADLNVKPANFNPRPTQYIAQIIRFNEELIKKGFAYEANGSVYFSVEKFPEYGKLSGKKKKDLIVGSRVEINPEKKNSLDFALWIKADKNHILKWPSPWSIGYPGWHIECSVMSYDLLGQDTFDIHGGGNENAFPHNENEIAQSETYLDKPMANYWFLWNMVMINGQKMSKSLGNFTTIQDALKKYKPAIVRLWILSSHYRSVIDYSEESLKQATVNFEKFNSWKDNLKNLSKNASNSLEEIDFSHIYKKRFEEAMDDDLNTPLALSVVYELISETNKLMAENKLSPETAKNIWDFWKKVNNVFGLDKQFTLKNIGIKKYKYKEDGIIIVTRAIEKVPKEIVELARKRGLARKNNDFQKSDELRIEIEKAGYVIKDLKDNNYKLSEK